MDAGRDLRFDNNFSGEGTGAGLHPDEADSGFQSGKIDRESVLWNSRREQLLPELPPPDIEYGHLRRPGFHRREKDPDRSAGRIWIEKQRFPCRRGFPVSGTHHDVYVPGFVHRVGLDPIGNGENHVVISLFGVADGWILFGRGGGDSSRKFPLPGDDVVERIIGELHGM